MKKFVLSLAFILSLSAQSVPVPTGTVTFMDGTANLATVTLVNGVASLTISTLAIGTHQITAVYSGDSNYLASTSPVITQVVNAQVTTKTATTSTAISNNNPATVGKSITFTDTISHQ